MRVPFIDLPLEHTGYRDDLVAAAIRVIDSGHYIGGSEVELLESELALASGDAHAIAVSSGTDALLASLMALELGPGDEVVTTTLSFAATAEAIVRVGATPVFCDVDEHGLLSQSGLDQALSQRTRAVIPVHLFGRRCDVRGPKHVHIIEDAAQSFASGPVLGLAACVSFFPTKNLGALGDGGCVLTQDAAFAQRIRLLRNHGAERKYHHEIIGGNFRLDAIQAAFLRVKLRQLPQAIAARRQKAARYRELLAPLPSAGLIMPDDTPSHVYHHFCVRTPARDALREALSRAGVGSEIYYPEPLHMQPCFARFASRPCPNAERACRELLALPMRPSLRDDEQDYVAEVIREFFRNADARGFMRVPSRAEPSA